MKGQRTDDQRLRDILEAIATIERHATDDHDRFRRDEPLRWMFRSQVQIIGEASFKLSASVRDAHPEVPWRAIVGMRHILVHDYFDVEWDVLWEVLQTHIAPLRAQMEAILKEREAHD
jgi:uncharacterized protein with HEPN domain